MALRSGPVALVAGVLFAQAPVPWVCPMDPGVRAAGPSNCIRCGMKLVPGIAAPVEFPVVIDMIPPAPKAGAEVLLRFRVQHPETSATVRHFEVVHEKLFHLFLVSRDLEFFAHEHPELQSDGSFVYRGVLPKGGLYRVLCGFYPAGGTPHTAVSTLMLPGRMAPPDLEQAVDPQQGQNVRVKLRTQPLKPIAGQKTLLFFDLDPADGLEPYLAANGHMLIASHDLIDMIHSHPAFPDGGPTVQFNAIFPRAGMHRIWVQFQRKGVMNTVAFTVSVGRLE